MKTFNKIKNLALIILITGLLQGYVPSNPVNIDLKEKKLKRIVSAAIDFPEGLITENKSKNIVTVDFNVTEDGHIVVNEINGEPSLSSSVKEKLEKLVIKKMSGLSGKSFIYRFIFSK